MAVHMLELNNSERLITLPTLALRGLCIFSNTVIHFDVGRTKSIKAIEHAMTKNHFIFLVAQKDLQTDNPTKKELYRMGTIAKIKQVLKMPGENLRILVEGISRAEIVEVVQSDPYFVATVKEINDSIFSVQNDIMAQALVRTVHNAFNDYLEYVPKIPNEIVLGIMDEKDPGRLADALAANLPLQLEDKQAILEELNHAERAKLIMSILANEIDVAQLEVNINKKVKDNIDKNQREYYLREQLKVIQGELGEGDAISMECGEYTERITKAKLPEEVEKRLLKEIERLSKTSLGSAEGGVIRTYLDTCLDLPWNKVTRDRKNILQAEKILNKDHYGMEKVKERILELLAVKQLNTDLKGQIICLYGPPGVGKTSVAKSIARALNRKFGRLSLGGMRDEADIRGHRKTYVGAMPGRIMNAVKLAGSKNPVILLDEIDKMGSDYKGDPSSAMLEVLDSEQNAAFRDHYIEFPFDLSNVLFITTANTLDTIPRPLLDRMELIELTSYTLEEKVEIAKRHLLPKQLKKHGIKKSALVLADDILRDIIQSYTRESGVRTLERELAALCRKTAKILVTEDKKRVIVTKDNLSKFLGVERYSDDKVSENDEVGVACGLAWTSVGGEILEVEVNVVSGSGKVELTGNLGDVMKESAYSAISYIRSRAEVLGIPKDFYKNNDLHINFPEGAVPKDGPSAGITVATAIISALTGHPIRRDVAMTGEITIRGRVLPIGGLKEKTMAAYRAGIETVIVPEANKKDLSEIDKVVAQKLNFVTASHMDKVLKIALIESGENTTVKKGEDKPLVPTNLFDLGEHNNIAPVLHQ